MMKNRTKSSLVKEYDALYSRYIRLKYSKDGKVQCVTCGKWDEIKNMQNGHYVSRRFYATRWNDLNCHPQCYRCNVLLGGNYHKYTKFMIDKYGSQVIDDLIELSEEYAGATRNDVMDGIWFYKVKAQELEDRVVEYKQALKY